MLWLTYHNKGGFSTWKNIVQNKISIRQQRQTFRFEIGSDEELYSVSFKGVIPEQEVNRILEVIHMHLHKNCGQFIRSYLDAHHLEYSDFAFHAGLLEHGTIMAFAGCLLHDSSCDCMDQWIGSTDSFYGIMDHQHTRKENCREGRYYAVSRTLCRQKESYDYHIIGQTFQYNELTGSEQSYFAIRQNNDCRHLYTLDETEVRPVLATFGCVDMMDLLIHIGTITTKQQAAGLANK